jgi:hypothetical protein
MATAWFPPALSLLLFLGLGSPVLGLLRLFPPPSGRSVVGAAIVGFLAACSAGFCVAAVVAGQPVGLWAPAVVFLALCASVALPCRGLVSAAAAQVTGLLRKPAVQVVGLLAGCPALALWGVLAATAVSPPTDMSESAPALDAGREMVDIRPSPFRTDKGREVAVARRTPPLQRTPERAARQIKLVTALGMHAQVIALPATSEDSNCHGWVFTRGRHWIRGEHVETILADNAYRQVTAPRPGDLTVYRGPDGAITHTGVVRTTVAGNVILVESKWGEMGAFVHPADVHPYDGSTATYHRSPRGDHALVAVPGPVAVAQSPTTDAPAFKQTASPPPLPIPEAPAVAE